MYLILKKRNTLFTAFLMVVMLFSFMPVTQPVAALTTCQAAQFVADVTIPDDTVFSAGATFNKTWRLRNVGCGTWNTNYSLVFVDGTQMNAPAAVSLPSSVAPGNTIDLTVGLTAPSSAGTYRGNFQLKDDSGNMFGIGLYANKSFWVEIVVSGSSGGPGTLAYDFVANASSANWTSGAGNLSFPGTDGDANGFAFKVAAPHLENGATDSAPGLLTEPQNVYNGYIQGQYPAYHVQAGDHFQSIVNCEFNATYCYVNFRLNYQIGNGPIQTFWSFKERYDGFFYRANFDLSSLAGQDVKFILYVGSAGYASGDRALWGAPRITHGGPGMPPPPPVTPPPGPSTCDRATFIADVNVPDGSVFAPNVGFTKTWRIKNIGTCTWTTNYKLVYVSGDKMGGPNSVNLTSTVGPNTSFDISVPLTSPSSAGSYRGYWQLKNSSGQLFGIGFHADKPWWVDIYVNTSLTPGPTSTKTPTPTPGASIVTSTPTPTVTPTPGSATVGLDFTLHPEGAEWKNGSGTLLTFGGTSGDAGYAFKLASVQMEDSITYNQPSLVLVPQNITDGFIQGTYPSYTVVSGDHFRALIGCMSGYPDCNVKFWLYFKTGGGTLYTIADYAEKFDTPTGLTRTVDIPLTSLVGQTGNFIIAIGANGSPTGDHAPWVFPRIEHP